MEIKELVKRLVAVKDKTAFARACGVSRATIYRIAGGWKNPEFKTLDAIDKQFKKIDRAALKEKKQ